MQSSVIIAPPSWRSRVWYGAYAIWCGLVLGFVFLVWGVSWIAVVMVAACFGLGVLLVRRGLRMRTSERAFRAEWSRAQAEWGELRSGATSARSRGQALDDYLRSCGYRVPGVVRAIAHDLSAEKVGE